MNQYRTPTILITSPFVLFAVLLVAMQLVYATFQPPAVFDFLEPNSSLAVQIAHNINSALFFILLMTPWVGVVSVIAGVALYIKQFFARRKYAKN